MSRVPIIWLASLLDDGLMSHGTLRVPHLQLITHKVIVNGKIFHAGMKNGIGIKICGTIAEYE